MLFIADTIERFGIWALAWPVGFAIIHMLFRQHRLLDIPGLISHAKNNIDNMCDRFDRPDADVRLPASRG